MKGEDLVIEEDDEDLMIKGGQKDEVFFEVRKETPKLRLDYVEGQ